MTDDEKQKLFNTYFERYLELATERDASNERGKASRAASNVNITIEGHEYVGGFVSSTDGQMEYARKKVDSLVHLLADIAKTEPQAAYALSFLVSADASITLSEQHQT